MMRSILTLALAWGASAQTPYTQTQAQSFQSLSRDVLAAIAPSIDPMYKLAAQTTLTFSGEKEPTDHWREIQYAMGDSLTYAIVNAERVTYFRALVAASPDQIAAVISTWAGVPADNVLVVKDTGDTGATPTQTAKSLTLYNVTVLPQPNPLNGPYVSMVDTVKGLIAVMPPNCMEEAACLCKVLIATPSWNDGCTNSFANASVGMRFTIDIFTDFDVPNSAMSDTIKSAWMTRCDHQLSPQKSSHPPPDESPRYHLRHLMAHRASSAPSDGPSRIICTI